MSTAWTLALYNIGYQLEYILQAAVRVRFTLGMQVSTARTLTLYHINFCHGRRIHVNMLHIQKCSWVARLLRQRHRVAVKIAELQAMRLNATGTELTAPLPTRNGVGRRGSDESVVAYWVFMSSGSARTPSSLTDCNTSKPHTNQRPLTYIGMCCADVTGIVLMVIYQWAIAFSSQTQVLLVPGLSHTFAWSSFNVLS